jgi:L-aminopeptidase/D-esterase-like protein
MQYLAEAGVGLPFGGSKVPIVCGAAIFDLAIAEGPPPDKRAGYEAARAASATEDHRGRVGGGAGATVGKALGRPGVMPGGLGMASAPCGPHTVSAIAVVNAVGDIFDRDGRIVAGARREDGSFADAVTLIAESGVMRRLPPIANTTLAIVATGAPLTRDAAVRVARMAHDGMARAIRPAHTLTDGDVVFVLSVPSADAPPADVGAIGTMAAEALQDAILDAVRPNA